MMSLAEREWANLVSRLNIRHMVHEDGCLELYESEAEFREAEKGWTLRTRFHIPFRHLEKIADYQPGLCGRFVTATFVPGWKTVSDPRQIGRVRRLSRPPNHARSRAMLEKAAQFMPD